MLKQCLKIMGIALIMCLIPSIAYAEDGKTVSYQGLTFFCETGSIENKVSLEGTKNKEIFINQGGEYTITGTWDVTAAGWDAYTFPNAVLTIETKENVTIILDNVSITAPNIDLQSRQIAGILCGDNSNVHIVLKGENKIDCSTYYNNSHSTGSAGIGTGTDANLVISGSGTLTAKGGQNHPAIGAIFSKQNANITINGGTVHAIGGSQGAGIGCYGGTSGSIGKILIEETNGEKIFITAEGGKNSGAGIGAGYETGFSEIRIESGTVRASSTNVSRSWSSGAGIGGSGNDSFAVRLGKIIINGGVVEATGTAYGAGIGGGSGQLADVEITGGKITAVGKWYGAGIGGGDGSKGTANLNIKDADVVAVSRFAEGIGAGSNGIAPGIELSNMSDLRVFSGQQLAINEGAVVTDCSILNTQFNEPLPYSVNLLQGFADAIMLQSIPADMKSFAYAFGEGGKKIQIQHGSETEKYACYSDGGDQFDFQLLDKGMLTKKGLSWKVRPIVTYRIDYTLDGGTFASGVSNPVAYKNEDLPITLNNPQKIGYNFLGWSGSFLTQVTPNVTISLGTTGDLAYQAHWEAVPYTITYNLDHGMIIGNNPESYTIESLDFTLINPTREGYTFLGWTGTGLDEVTKNVVVRQGTSGNLVFTAHWQKDNTGGGVVDTYTLRYDTNGGAKIVSESKSAAWVKAYDELPVPSKEGAVFAGWYWDKALNKPVEDDVKINRSLVTLYAKWEKDLADPDNTGVSDWLDTVNHHAYLGGYPDNTFGGERDMTRAEVAQMFYNLLLNKNVPITVRFDDVAEDAWYATAVNTLASLDILQGVGDNNFAPQRSITRAEFTCILPVLPCVLR